MSSIAEAVLSIFWKNTKTGPPGLTGGHSGGTQLRLRRRSLVIDHLVAGVDVIEIPEDGSRASASRHGSIDGNDARRVPRNLRGHQPSTSTCRFNGRVVRHSDWRPTLGRDSKKASNLTQAGVGSWPMAELFLDLRLTDGLQQCGKPCLLTSSRRLAHGDQSVRSCTPAQCEGSAEAFWHPFWRPTDMPSPYLVKWFRCYSNPL